MGKRELNRHQEHFRVRELKISVYTSEGRLDEDVVFDGQIAVRYADNCGN
jgi:hypothetical protein